MTIIVRKPTEEEIKQAERWPIWSKDVSEFDWNYNEPETCLILEGQAEVIGDDGEITSFMTGDWVIFPIGFKCRWKINEAIKKKYIFG
jgi:uncharacterized protein